MTPGATTINYEKKVSEGKKEFRVLFYPVQKNDEITLQELNKVFDILFETMLQDE